MNKPHLLLPVAAVLALMALAPARAQGNTAAFSGAPAPKTTTLPAMTVYGHRLPLPVALQVIKKGLKLPWNNNLNDTRIRWRLESQAGSHFRTLWCERNRHHILRTNQLQTNLMTAAAAGNPANPLEGVPVSTKLGFSRPINVSALMGWLHKIPGPDASYTFRVTAHGKPVAAYVIKDGELVHIYHYVYKKGGQSTKH